jgi:hypothetical protein
MVREQNNSIPYTHKIIEKKISLNNIFSVS